MVSNALVQYGRSGAYSGTGNYVARGNDNYPVALARLERIAFPNSSREAIRITLNPLDLDEDNYRQNQKQKKADLPLTSDFGEGLKYANLRSLQYLNRSS